MFLLRDLDTQRVYRLYDFTKALLLRPGVAYSVAGKVNSADKLYLGSNRSGSTPSTHGIPMLMLLLTAREGRLSANQPGCPSSRSSQTRPTLRPRPAPTHSCVSRFRPAVFLTTKSAILRAFYIGTNTQRIAQNREPSSAAIRISWTRICRSTLTRFRIRSYWSVWPEESSIGRCCI